MNRAPFAFEIERKEDGAGRRSQGKRRIIPGDRITWRGTWRGRPVRFVTEPKLADTSVYFLTSSNARINFDRPLGAQVVELRPLTPIDDLAGLLAYCQQYDTRPLRLAGKAAAQ